MKPFLCPVFLLLQASVLAYSKPSLNNVTLSVHPTVHTPSQPFTLTCTVDVSPPNGAYGVGFTLNDTDIGWWSNFKGAGFTWASKPYCKEPYCREQFKYIVPGVASYPNFTATILGNYFPQTRGLYKCIAYYNERGGQNWGFGKVQTTIGYDNNNKNNQANGSFTLTSSTPVFSFIGLLLLKYLYNYN